MNGSIDCFITSGIIKRSKERLVEAHSFFRAKSHPRPTLQHCIFAFQPQRSDQPTLTHVSLPDVLSLCDNAVSWPWTETFGPRSQNKCFLLPGFSAVTALEIQVIYLVWMRQDTMEKSYFLFYDLTCLITMETWASGAWSLFPMSMINKNTLQKEAIGRFQKQWGCTQTLGLAGRQAYASASVVGICFLHPKETLACL